jgi:uncharacterized OB-fold protein
LVKIAELLVGTTGTFKCPECGTKVLENTGYCIKCEKKVKQASNENQARGPALMAGIVPGVPDGTGPNRGTGLCPFEDEEGVAGKGR